MAVNKINKKKENPTVRAISRAVEILHCIANGTHSIKEISTYCDLSLGTAHRILSALEELKFVFQDPISRKYFIGSSLDKMLIDRTTTHQFFIAHSSPEVNRIWKQFGEFTGLDIHVGLQKVHLLALGSKFNYGVTRAFPSIFYGADSKTLLSQHSDDEIDTILNSFPIDPPSENCSVEKKDLKKEIQLARTQGYFISKEFANGIMGISVPVKTYFCPAALTLAGPEARLDPIASQVVKEMKKACGRIEKNISVFL